VVVIETLMTGQGDCRVRLEIAESSKCPWKYNIGKLKNIASLMLEWADMKTDDNGKIKIVGSIFLFLTQDICRKSHHREFRICFISEGWHKSQFQCKKMSHSAKKVLAPT